MQARGLRRLALMVGIATQAATAPACRSGLLEPPDDAREAGPGGGGAPDLAPAVCRTHRIEFQPLDRIVALHPADLHLGAAVLLQIDFSLREGCDVPGDVSVNLTRDAQQNQDLVLVAMRVWRGSRDCGPGRGASRIIAIADPDELLHARLIARDGAPGGTAQALLDIGRPDGFVCDPQRPGEECGLDCQCLAAEARSVCSFIDDRDGLCGVPCTEDVDCGGGLGCDRTTHLCAACPMGSQACGCSSDAGCPFGQRCVGWLCQPMEGLPPPSKCDCDGDCGPGRLCSQSGSCVIPCTTMADCPGGAPRCMAGTCG